ncbi:MAG: MotA/TolQ/ExbB proton channel family protein [Verrucomicrobiota bacterium]
MKLESGLIILAIAVSGAPFLGLLGTVWGVMDTFAGIARDGQRFDGGDGAGRFGGTRDDSRGVARRDPLDVRLQLARA